MTLLERISIRLGRVLITAQIAEATAEERLNIH